MFNDLIDYSNLEENALPEAYLRIKIYTTNQEEIYLESLTLESDPTFRILNIDSKGFRTLGNVLEETAIRDLLKDEAIEVLNHFKVEIRRSRLSVNNPLTLVDSLVSTDPNDQVLVLKTDVEYKGVPRLDSPALWFGELKGESGWQLILKSFSYFSFGFAKWNDKEGILNLVKRMNDSEIMLAMIALDNPHKAALMTAEYEIKVSLAEESGRVQVSELLSIIRNEPLLNSSKAFSRLPDYSLATLHDKSIAVRIFPPSFNYMLEPRKGFWRSIPWLAKTFFEQRKLSDEEIAEMWDSRISREQDLWIKTVEEKILEKGWYRVKLLDQYEQPAYFFTDLPKEFWSKIEKFKSLILYTSLDNDARH